MNRNHKGAKDAAEWQPEANQCWFAQTVVAVRRAYRLTIDRREADALDGILVGCSSTEMMNFRRRRGDPAIPLPSAPLARDTFCLPLGLIIAGLVRHEHHRSASGLRAHDDVIGKPPGTPTEVR